MPRVANYPHSYCIVPKLYKTVVIKNLTRNLPSNTLYLHWIYMKFVQSGTRNNGKSDYPRSDNEIWDKYEVTKWNSYEVNLQIWGIMR